MSFMEIHQLVQIVLKWSETRHDNIINLYFLVKQGNQTNNNHKSILIRNLLDLNYANLVQGQISLTRITKIYKTPCYQEFG